MNLHFQEIRVAGCALAGLALVFASAPLRAADEPPVDDRVMFDDFKINGQPVRMSFDSGAEGTAIFRPAAVRLGLKYSTPSPDAKLAPGESPVGRTDPVEFQFGSRTMTNTLAVLDLPDGLHADFDGVVGWGPLRRNFFVFDAASSRAKIDAAGRPPTPSDAWLQLPLRKDSPMLILDVPGQSGRTEAILIDTGAPDGVRLSPARWREWRTAHADAATTMDAYYTPGIGLVVEEVAWAKELTLGPLTLSNVTVKEGAIEDLLIPGYEATLGLTTLKGQNVVIDGKNGMAYFSRLTLPAKPFAHNRLGAVFVPSDMQHEPLEAHVAKGSPAETAGIRNGDVLLKIDALDVTKWRTDPAVMPMSKFWQRPAGTKFALALKRGDKEFSVAVTLRDTLGPDVSTAGPTPSP